MKINIRTMMMTACVLAVLAGGCLSASGTVRDKTLKEGETAMVRIPNPFITRETLAEAEAEAGFTFAVPDTYEGNGIRLVQTSSDGMIQVFYGDGERNDLLIRKAPGEGDISGDYNAYSSVEEKEISGITVTVRADESGVHTMTWTDGSFSYAVLCEEGMTEETALMLAGSVH